MTYEITQQEPPTGVEPMDIVVITYDDGSNESFPADAENPRYKQFLIEIGEAEPELPEEPVTETPVEEVPVEEAPVEAPVEEPVDKPVTGLPIAE